MPGSREIRTQIKSIKNTQKITRAMEMVAAAKMRRAQEKMSQARPYAQRIREVAGRLAMVGAEQAHPYLQKRPKVQGVGIVVVTSDKGLCGGLNANLMRLVFGQLRAWEQESKKVAVCAIGRKGLQLLQRTRARIVVQEENLGDTPQLAKLIGPLKVMLDLFDSGEVDEVHIAYSRFINTMRQEPTLLPLLPVPPQALETGKGRWEYLFEPSASAILGELLVRFIESQVYWAVAENMASEQSARMVAMKSATDNAGNLVEELTLIYNKSRQAAITKEISEIVAGAEAL